MSSHDVPFEIQAEIINRLPAKSLLKFLLVSKAWKSLIQSSYNIASYSNHHTRVQHLLVRYIDPFDFESCDTSSEYKYVSVVNDSTFPQRKVSLTSPLLVISLISYSIIGSSCGLLCLYGRRDHRLLAERRVVLWNPLLGKAVAVVVRNEVRFMRYLKNPTYQYVLGFGVCRVTTDPIIVKIKYIHTPRNLISLNDHIPCQVEIFTLSTGAWRRPYCNAPRTSIKIIRSGLSVDVDGVIYWLASDRKMNRGEFEHLYYLIISFDIKTEEFKEVNLPDTLAYRACNDLYLHKLNKSLVVLQRGIMDIWVMEDGDPKLFTKLISVESPNASLAYLPVRGFRKTGEPVFETEEHLSSEHNTAQELSVYDPYSKQVNNIGINGIRNSFSVYSNMESLLLIDQPDFKVYEKI